MARYEVRRSVMGCGWYVKDNDPGTYSRVEGTRPPIYFRDTFAIIGKNKHHDYFRTYQGAANLAARLNNDR